jgi:hypothetical protein
VEGTEHLDLVALANRRKAIVKKHSAEVCTSFKVVEVDAMRFRHKTPTRKELS